MDLFKTAFASRRENGDEIYKGFGFRHYSDVTQYYVHPNNQSASGKTSVCQPIGEAISLFSLLLAKLVLGRGVIEGEIYSAEDTAATFVHILVPNDWRNEGVVGPEIYAYRAHVSEDGISIGAYSKSDELLRSSIRYLHQHYKLLPCFIALLAAEMRVNERMRGMLLHYIENPAADTFVNIHEDFYQDHKANEYQVIYKDISGFDLKGFSAMSAFYQSARDNRKEMIELPEHRVSVFPPDAFREEYKQYIPRLPAEFMLPAELLGVCRAVMAGDVLATLLHGPSGTGKTISCKLICQTIGLPIMETVGCTENLDEFVLGKFIPQDDRIVFKESYVTKAIRFGGAVVFEEINFAKPQYLSFLNSLLDDNGFVRLDNGEVVYRHLNFRFFATMNFGYFGTRELNQALYNRFDSIIEVAALSDEAIRRMLQARVPECEPVMDKLLGVYHKLKKKIEIEELDNVISPRNIENWARLAKYEGYMRASEKTILPIAKCERVLEDTIRGIITLYKWN